MLCCTNLEPLQGPTTVMLLGHDELLQFSSVLGVRE